MLVAGALFACMGVFVKLGADHFSSAELVFYRSLFGLIVIYAIVRGNHYALATSHARMHVWRSASGFAALMLFFYSISMLPLATAVTLNYTAPLFLALFVVAILKERPGMLMLLAVALGFVGVVWLLRPTMGSHQMLGGVLGLASGFLSGIAYLNVKQLANLGEPDWRTVFYFTLFSTLGSGIWMLIHAFHAITAQNFFILLGMGVCATLAQLAMTRAYREGVTLVVASLAYSTVIFASFFDVVLWGIALDSLSWLAMGLIITSGILASKTTQRLPAN
jgi:drug/metabolite transporter (DMT)-like permease